MSAYAFGDSDIAAERLEIVADTFAPTTRTLLQSLDARPRRVLDLGCGPGHTTELLAALFPYAELVAIEFSEPFAALARERVPSARVIVGDVTAALPTGFDLVSSRFLLSHLPDIGGPGTGRRSRARCDSVEPAPPGAHQDLTPKRQTRADSGYRVCRAGTDAVPKSTGSSVTSWRE